MRDRFAALMVGSARADSFALLTAGVDRQGVAFRKLPATLARIDLMDAFLSATRDKARSSAN